MSAATPTRVVVAGAAGRMGEALVRAAGEAGVEVAGAFERPGHPRIGEDVGTLAGLEPLGRALDGSLGDPGGDAVLIEFTSPEATVSHLRAWCDLGRGGAVIGTTGLSAEDRAAVEAAAARIPVVLAPNMSMGVNLIFELAAQAARVLGDAFDVEIVETHHGRKKDAPSGTAVGLLERVAAALGRDPVGDAVHGREGMVGERTGREIGMHALRGGDVVGEHTVTFFGAGERVEITHRATDRAIFARGAVRAATWLSGRAPGLYDMADVLGLKAGQSA